MTEASQAASCKPSLGAALELGSRHRRTVIKALLGCAAAVQVFAATAQDSSGYPAKPIRILAASAPGGLIDIAARAYAEKMQAHFKQTVVVENVVGAGGLLAVRQSLKAPADGLTLLVMANHLVWMPHMSATAGYALKDFAPLGEMVRSPSFVLTSAASPYLSLPELLEQAKRNPGQISFASGGVGSTNHLSAELLASQAGVKFTHVPYKGISPAIPDVTSGRVTFFMPTASSVGELMKSGALRALGITSAKRSVNFPDIPTLGELGYPSFDTWIGLFAPAAVPSGIQRQLAQAMEVARNDVEFRGRFTKAGHEISAVRSQKQFEAMLRADDQKFRKLISDAKISSD